MLYLIFLNPLLLKNIAYIAILSYYSYYPEKNHQKIVGERPHSSVEKNGPEHEGVAEDGGHLDDDGEV